MRVTIDLMKKSTQIIDLSDVINPRVGDDDLLLPLHIVYGDNQTDMRGKDVEFISEDTNKQRIYVGGTCNTDTPGDNLLMGNLTFRFPAGTFKADGTYDPDKTMFRIVDKETQKVISSVNVKITVMKNSLEFDFDPDNTSYDSRLEEMLHGFHDQGQAMLDDIKNLNDQAKSNVSGDTAATAKEAKKQADTNAGDISDLKGEVAGARGRFADMAGREDAQDIAINQKESIANANANYAALQQKDAQQDTAINQKETIVNANANYAALKQKDAQQDAALADKAGKFELENKLAQIDLQPEIIENEAVLKTKYPSGKVGLIVTADTWHKYVWVNNSWQDCGELTDNAFKDARDASQDILYGQDILEWDKSTKGIVVPATEDFASFEDKPIMHLHSTSTDDYVYLISDTVTVSKHIISVQFPEMIKNLIGIKDAAMEIRQLSPADDPADHSTFADNSIWLNFSDPQMTLYKAPNLKLKEKTDRIQIVYQIHGIGDVYVGKPVINYGSKCISYSPFQSIQDAQIVENKLTSDILHISQNLLSNQDIRNWTQNTQNKVQVTSETSVQFHATPIMHMIGTEDDQWNRLFSNEIPVTQHTISLQLPEMVANQIYGKSKGYISIVPLSDGEKYGDKSTFGKLINLTLSNTMMKLHRYSNITLPENTSRIVIDIIQYGKGDLYFGDPVINYGSTFVPYDQLEISEKFDNVLQRSKENSSNLLYGMDVTSFNNSVKGKASIATEADKQFNGTTIMHITGTEDDQWNHSISKEIPVTQHTISLQLPEMVANQIYGKSKGYISIVPLSDGEKYGDKSTYGKLINLTLSNLTMKLQRYPNITLPENTSRIVIDIIQYGIGDLYFGVPVINYGPQCITYDQITLSQDLTNLANKVGNSGDVFPIPEMHINTDSSSYGYNKKPVAFRFLESGNVVSGYLNFDIQGDSSRAYDKKNFKIKLYKDADGQNNLKTKMQSSWPKTNKYNLKANWIDATQARNIVNARLVKDAVAVTPLENPAQTSKILSTEGLGQVDGFPIELYFNDDYYGLYTLNTKKDETTFGMDSKDVTNEVLSTELGKKDLTDSTKAIIDGTNWSTEIHDTATENIKGNLVKFLNFVEQSSDTDFRANLKNYIDVSSVINLILFGWLSQEYDFYSKSELFATWNDGGYWYLIPYDLDSTWGLFWDGSDVVTNRDAFDLSKIFSDPQTAWAASANDNKFQQRVMKLFKPEIKKQGQLLRSTVWSTPNIIAKFKDFIDEVPTFAYQRDQEKWTTIPSIKTTDFKQIQSAVIQRGQEFDDFLNKI